MPSAPRTPKKPTNFNEAMRVYDEVDPLVEARTAEKAKLLEAGGAIDTLDKQIAELRAAIAKEAAKQPPETPDGDLMNRLTETIDTTLQPQMVALRAELAQIDAELAGYAAELAEAGRVVTQGIGLGEKPPEHIVAEDTALRTAVEAREAEIRQLYERLNMPAILAFEAHVFPTQARVDQFLTAYNNAQTRGTVLDFGSLLALDESTIEKMAGAVKLLGKTPTSDPEALAATVKGTLEAYRSAYEAYKQAGLAGDAAAAGRAGRAIHKSVAELHNLPKANEDAFRKQHAAYDARVALIQEHHAPAIQAAEQSLYKAVPDPADREGLVKARTKEVVAAAPTPAPEHPIFKELETEKGQREQVAKVLAIELGLPFNPQAVGNVFAIFSKEVTGHGIAEGKDKRKKRNVDAQKDAWLALKQDVIHDIGAKKLTDAEKASVEDRLQRVKPTAPNAKFIEVLIASMDSQKPLKDRGAQLTDAVVAYIDALPAVKAEADPVKADDLMKAAIEKLNPVFEGFKKLISGETQAEQATAGVTDAALLLKPAREYAQVFADATPAPTVTPAPTGPDPRKAAEASVHAFILSMERVTALGEETKKLESARTNVLTAAHEGRVAVQASNLADKNLVTKKAKVATIKTELTRLQTENVPKRKAVVDAWKQAHIAEVAAKKKTLGEREKELRAIDVELDAHQKSGEEAAIRARIRKTAEVLNALHAKDLIALSKLGKEHDEILDRAQPVTVAGKNLSGRMFVYAMVHEGEHAPLSDRRVVGDDAWIPDQLRTITRAQFADVAGTPTSATVEDRIRSAYQLADTETKELRTIADWFVQHPHEPQGGMGAAADAYKKAPGFLKGLSAAASALVSPTTSSELLSDNAALETQGKALRDKLVDVHQMLSLQYATLERDVKAAQVAGDTKEAARLIEVSKPVSRNKVETEGALRELEAALASPGNTSVKDFYGHALRALYTSLQGLNKEYVPTEQVTNDNDGFKSLQKHLSRVGKTPDTDTVAKIERVVAVDISRRDDYFSQLSTVINSIENHPKTNLTGEADKLKKEQEKGADILKRQREKDVEVKAADAELKAAEAKKLEDDTGLKSFDAIYEQALEDVDPLGDIAALPEFERIAKAAKEKLPLADKALRDAMENTQRAYIAWLDKKGALLTPTSMPTESETASIQSAKDHDVAIFSLFEAHGAPKDGKKASFEAWVRGLDVAKKTALVRALAPELYPTP